MPHRETGTAVLEKERGRQGKSSMTFIDAFKKSIFKALRWACFVLVLVLGGVAIVVWIKNMDRTEGMLGPHQNPESAVKPIEKSISLIEEKLNENQKQFENFRDQQISRNNETTSLIAFFQDAQKNQEVLLEKNLEAATSKTQFQDLDSRIKALETLVSNYFSTPYEEGSSKIISDLRALKDNIQNIETRLTSHILSVEEKFPQGSEAAVKALAPVSDNKIVEDLIKISRDLQDVIGWKESTTQFLALEKETLERLSREIDTINSFLLKQKSGAFGSPDMPFDGSSLFSQMEQLHKKLEEFKTKLSDQETYVRNLQLFFAYFDLKKAIEVGAGFEHELETLKNLAHEKVDLTALEAFKKEGVPPLNQIKKESQSLFPLRADLFDDLPSQTLWQALLSRAKTLVQIRRLSDAKQQDQIQETEVLFQKALKEERWADALKEADKFPPHLKDRISEWYKKVLVRVTVDQTLADLEKTIKIKLLSELSLKTHSSGF